jgi:outer membrane autotransporter protein
MLIGMGLAAYVGVVPANARCKPEKPGKSAEQTPPGKAKGRGKGERPCGPDDSAASLLGSRSNLSLTSDSDSERLIARLSGAPSRASGPITGAHLDEDGSRLGLHGRMGLGGGAESQSRPSHGGLAMWVEGQLASFNNSGEASFDGRFGIVYLGADYVVTPTVLVGVLVQYDDISQRSARLDSAAEGAGWMAGPYAMVQLSPHLYWQVRAMWGQSSSTVDHPGSAANHFDSERWLLRNALIGRWRLGDVEFRPSASIAYADESTNGLTDPNVAVHSTLGQAKFGPEFAYRHTLADGTMIEPRWSLQGIWNFDQEVSGALAGNLAGPQEVRGRMDVGLRAVATQGVDLDLSAGYDGLGSPRYQAVSGRVQVRVPLQ